MTRLSVKWNSIFILGLASFCALVACKREEKFPTLGDKVASPADLAVSDDNSFFYALNADFDRTYNVGSILVLSANGEKIRAVSVPRLGRSITVAGSDMLVTFDYADENSGPKVMLFNVADPANPVFVKEWIPECSPLNAVMRKGYDYFAVSCSGGELLLGTLKANRAESELKLVRRYEITRRAMHLDPARGLLFMFSTNLRDQRWVDLELEDSKTFSDQQPDGTAGANEIPDDYEKSRKARSNVGSRRIYQYAVYNIGREAAHPGEAFPLRTLKDDVFNRELRWTYFSLSNFDGTPDTDAGYTADGLKIKYYRTNFFSAQPDPEDADAFYLSQRGHSETNRTGSQHANNVIRVKIIGDVAGPETGTLPTTADTLSFERVYGFKGEINDSGLQYPGDFKIARVGGEPLLLVNHFRDLVYWPRSQVYFSVAAKVIGEDYWHDEMSSTDPFLSYYQVALTNQGRGMACSFYGSALILFDVQPGTAIKEITRIK